MADKRSTGSRTSINLKLENFRLFKDSGWFKLAPLTCLVGRNSSGKSSVLNAILLLKQSVEREAMGSALMPLALTGPYCDLGNYGDVVHNHDESSEISLSMSIPLEDLATTTSAIGTPFVNLALPRATNPYRSYYYSRFGRVPHARFVRARLLRAGVGTEQQSAPEPVTNVRICFRLGRS